MILRKSTQQTTSKKMFNMDHPMTTNQNSIDLLLLECTFWCYIGNEFDYLYCQTVSSGCKRFNTGNGIMG